MNRCLIVCLWILGFSYAPEAANWPGWRGTDSSGSTEAGKYPVSLDPANALWKTALPGKGCSTPIVWDRQIYVTVPIDGLDGVVAFDWAGKPVWQTKLGPESPGKHRNGSGSNPSPATDGRRLYVYYKSGTLAAIDLTGKTVWQTNLVTAFGPETLYWDQGTSPVLTRDLVVIARMHHGESWLVGFDKDTGKLKWKADRNYETPTEGDNAYTTPVVTEDKGNERIIVWGGEHVTAHETTSGKTVWVCGGFNPQKVSYWPAVASPVVASGMVMVSHGRADRGQPRFYGIKLGGTGDVTSTHRLWSREDTGTFVPTGAQYRGHVYLVRDRGEVECIEPATGKSLWKEALPKSSANFYASPLIANGILYAIREDGATYTCRVSQDKFELVSETKLGERVIASPTAVSDRVLIRGERNLFCFQGS